MDINLTQAEQIIMATIWDANEPISAVEIQNKNKEQNWKIQTINTFLKRMLKREVITYEKNKIGKTQAYYYKPLISEKELLDQKSYTFFKTFHNSSVESLLSSLTNSNKITKKDLEETKQWLQSMEDLED